MKKSIFVFSTLLLAFAFYFISPTNLVLADQDQMDFAFEMNQDSQDPDAEQGLLDTDSTEIQPEGETARIFGDETPDDGEEDIKQEDDSLDLEDSDEEEQEKMSLN